MRTSTHIVAGALLVMMLSLLLFLGWAFFFEPPWLVYENIPFPPLRSQVRAGESVPVTVRRCNNSGRARQYDIAHSILPVGNVNAWVLPSAHVIIEPGCLTVTSLLTVLPKEIPPGRYILFGASTIEGLVRTHVIEWYSQEFEVVP